MKKKAVFFCENRDNILSVFSETQRKILSDLVELRPEIIGTEAMKTLDLQDVEIILSTWGMPSLDTATIAKHFPNLKAVFYAAGATDDFARPFFSRGVRVLSAWRANAIPVAEFCVAQILLALKGYFRNTREINTREDWSREKAFVGPGIYGETVALIGAGAIATKIQEMLTPFHLKVIVVPSRQEKRTVSLEEVFRTAFVISNHLPNRQDNIGALDGHLFQTMRPGAVFINTGRGAQVNESDLIETLEARPDLTALLDVTSPEPPENGSKLYSLPNVQLTSHIAGSVNDEVHRMSDYMIDELRNFLSGKPLQYEVQESMLLTSVK